MSETQVLALVGVCADLRTIGQHPFHVVGDKYARAVAVAAGAQPLIIPALAEHLDIASLLDRLDGVLLTGSPSNVHPRHYDQPPSEDTEPHDEARDNLTLELIRATLAQRVPLFAICRGFQELNVALGGSLHPALHKLPGRMDHRSPKDDNPDVNYAPRHDLMIGGQLAEWLGAARIQVNSLHRQGVDRLAAPLIAEGFAEDGTIEAVRVKDAQTFAFGVQWHPEYKVTEDANAMRLFQVFGAAVRERAEARRR